MFRAVSSFWKSLNPVRLTGPLFDKELRVSSRRKRNYFLRFIYVGLLTVFVAIVWESSVAGQVSTTFQKSRMAEAGRTIITTVVTFQFVMTQLLAIIMLSNSISDEVYNRTLGLLMTTPINSFQIVMGKLCSKLLQLVLLLAVSLPLLAIVRVLGGVPWDYVLSSLCITLTAVIFCGVLSLFFSIRNRRAYVVIIKTVVTMGFVFGLLPQIIGSLLVAPRTFTSTGLLQASYFPVFWHALSHFSPYYAMTQNTALLLSPAMPAGIARFYWPVHCAVMLWLSVLLMLLCGAIVRRVALQQATGQIDYSAKSSRRRKGRKSFGWFVRDEKSAGIIRRVRGSAVFWKDIRAPLIRGGEGTNSIIGLGVTVFAIMLTYGAWARAGYLDEDFTHGSYVVMFVVIGMVFHFVLSASSISSEKESRAWPILLTTSMGDWQILLGKAAAVLRRCLVVWLLLAGHMLVFVVAGYIHPIAVLHLLMLVIWLVVFLTSAGLYFSARFRRTTWAVVAAFGLGLGLWAVAPTILGLLAVLTHKQEVVSVSTFGNPLVQAWVIMSGTCGGHSARSPVALLKYDWLDRNLNFAGTTAVLAINMLIYVFFGLLFAWRAKCRLRRGVF